MTPASRQSVSYAYPVAHNTIGPSELEAASMVLASDRLTMSDRVREFEMAFASWTSSEHAVMVNSGSSANLLMVEAMLRSSAIDRPWQPGDEILVPALSWPTTVWPVVQLGLTPVFTDIDPTTLAIDLRSAERVISDRTRGMMLIHVVGQPPDMADVLHFADAHELDLLEDACEALGSHDRGRHVGTMGRMGSFSFYFSHHLTTIEGGMVTTSDRRLDDDLRSMRSHGWSRDRNDRGDWQSAHDDIDNRFLFVTTGYNLRPTEINAAIGLAQLDRLDSMLHQRHELAAWVADRVERVPWLRLIGAERLTDESLAGRAWMTHSWMMLPFEILDQAPITPKEVIGHLERAGVETRPIIAGNLVRHPAVRSIRHRHDDDLLVADRLLRRGFMIGCHPGPDPSALSALEEAFARLEEM